jgi:hypothetical protein
MKLHAPARIRTYGMPTPIACARIKTSPGFGSGTGTSRHCSTLDAPGSPNSMSFMLRSSARRVLRCHVNSRRLSRSTRLGGEKANRPMRQSASSDSCSKELLLGPTAGCAMIATSARDQSRQLRRRRQIGRFASSSGRQISRTDLLNNSRRRSIPACGRLPRAPLGKTATAYDFALRLVGTDRPISIDRPSRLRKRPCRFIRGSMRGAMR